MIDQLAKQLLSDIKGTIDSRINPDTTNERNQSLDLGPSQIKAIIESGLKKLNLVTREEFDAQQAVLLRTREKLDKLETIINELEKEQPHN